MSLTRPAAPSYSCSRKTHKSAWPNPFSKQRKRPRLAHSGLFLFALDTDHGPAAWNLYFCKGPLVFKAGTAGSLLPCNERSLLWAQGQLRPGVQRGAYAKAPTPVILKRATSFSPPLRHKPDISTCQQVVVAVLPFPGTQPRHSTPSHILAEGSSSPAQACSPAPHCPWNETSILPGASRPSMNLTLWLLFPIPTVASAAGIFISLCFHSSCFGCQEYLSSPSCQTPTHPPKPSSDVVTAFSCMAAPLYFPGFWFIPLSQHLGKGHLHAQSLLNLGTTEGRLCDFVYPSMPGTS